MTIYACKSITGQHLTLLITLFIKDNSLATTKMKTRNYTLSDIDKQGHLKVSPLLFLIMLYLSRHLLLIAVTAVKVFASIRRKSSTSPFEDMVELSSGPLFLIASAFSILVLVAMVKRTPDAGRLIRWIWRNGKWLLIAAATLDVIFLLITHDPKQQYNNLVIMITALINCYIIFYLIKSIRVQDTFSDFPAAVNKQKPSK